MISALAKTCSNFIRQSKISSSRVKLLAPEASDQDIAWIKRCLNYTMTTPESLWSLMKSVRYVQEANVEGDIVECGVWRGGNLVMAGLCMEQSGQSRPVWGYDTFTGMAEPGEVDVSSQGIVARDEHQKQAKGEFNKWCYSAIDEVKDNLRRELNQTDHISLIKGKVEDTLIHEDNLPKKISILRLDTDWYESTKLELEVLYPRLVDGGLLIIDDYGAWQGSRKAVDEYFSGKPIFLQRVDNTCRLMINRI